MNRIKGTSLLLAVLVGCFTALPASAAGVGPRIGLTIDPDQVHAGLHVHAAELSRHVAFDPSFDLGAGDDLLLFAANFDFKYVFSNRLDRWRPYLGGGPGLFVASYDGHDSNTDVGVSFIGGMQTATRRGYFFGEMRLGLVDSPDVKFTAGWIFF